MPYLHSKNSFIFKENSNSYNYKLKFRKVMIVQKSITPIVYYATTQ